uniref:Thioredoxin domain-containing protein n=1 Tax=Macrostomum lignano TaxID=282301 RepID=A0A1I8ITA0_9PLAT
MRANSLLTTAVVSCLLLSIPPASAHPASHLSGAADPPAAESSGTSVNIIHVNPLQIERDLRDYDTAIVFYYVEYCPVCAQLRPVYAKASYLLQQQQLDETLDGETSSTRRVLAAVNCGANARSCIRTGVTRVPLFKRFRNGGRISEVLRYPRVNAQMLLAAVNA